MIRTMFIALALASAALFGGGCTSAPTAEQLAAADYGVKPSQSRAEGTASAWVRARLKDPKSAQISWAPLEKAWFRQGYGKARFAWRLKGGVNAKNSFGGYTGAKLWAFYFRGDKLVVIGEPYTGRYGTDLIYVEVDGADWGDND